MILNLKLKQLGFILLTLILVGCDSDESDTDTTETTTDINTEYIVVDTM